MKNYKYLIPLALVILMTFSVFTTISGSVSAKNEYEGYLTEARKQAKLGVLEDALASYESALEIRDTTKLRTEVGDMYLDHDWTGDAMEWGENTVELFPEDPEAYAFLLKCYIAAENYEDCFALRDEAQGRDLVSENFAEMMKGIEYKYEMEYGSYEDVSTFGGGYCAVKSDGKWGYVDGDGDLQISEEYRWADAFSTDGIAAVQDKDGKYYYINTGGNKKIAVQNLKKCTGLGMLIGELLPAADNGKYHYYDKDFNIQIKDSYTYATPMNGDAAAVEQSGRWFLIDPSGKRLTDEDYDEIILDGKGIAYRNDRAFVKKDDQFFLIDSSGKYINKEPYEDAMPFLQADGFAAVKRDGLWGFVDKDGKEVIKPAYEDARSLSNGYAAVKIDGKWGFIDESGKLVIKNQFQDAKDFNEFGCVFVKAGGDWQLLKLLRNNYE